MFFYHLRPAIYESHPEQYLAQSVEFCLLFGEFGLSRKVCANPLLAYLSTCHWQKHASRKENEKKGKKPHSYQRSPMFFGLLKSYQNPLGIIEQKLIKTVKNRNSLACRLHLETLRLHFRCGVRRILIIIPFYFRYFWIDFLSSFVVQGRT